MCRLILQMTNAAHDNRHLVTTELTIDSDG